MKKPFFSIIASCFNCQSFIPRAVSSILQQKFTDYELIFVDDCSNDDSLDIARKICCDFEKAIFIKHSTNKSLLQTRVSGIRAASGEYLIFFDIDDMFPCTSSLQKMHDATIQFQTDIIAFKHALLPRGSIISRNPSGIARKTLENDDFSVPIFTSLWAKVIRTDIAKKAVANIHPETYINYSEDQVLFSLIKKHATSYAGSASVVYAYIDNATSISSTINTDIAPWIKQLDTYRVCIQLLHDNGLTAPLYKWKIALGTQLVGDLVARNVHNIRRACFEELVVFAREVDITLDYSTLDAFFLRKRSSLGKAVARFFYLCQSIIATHKKFKKQLSSYKTMLKTSNKPTTK